MSVLEAVLALAQLVKQLADDSTSNIAACSSLAHRVDLIPRMLEGFPDSSLLDDRLMQRLFQQLRNAHALICKYKDMNRMSRALRASMIKTEFEAIENEIEKCIRDLTLAVGIYSASKLSTMGQEFSSDRITGLTVESIVIDENEDACLDMADFGEMCDSVEELASKISVFSSSNNNSHIPLSKCAAVMFGKKLIELNFPLLDESFDVGKITNGDIEEEENNDTCQKQSFAGIVIFHIDNTTSMKNFDRMSLTKATLLNVIPDLLRKGFKVIVNAWASDTSTKGKIQTRYLDISRDILNSDDNIEKIKEHIQNEVFPVLVPNGKTDLYGSIFQLLRQTVSVSQEYINGNTKIKIPFHIFVLTDGNHNHLDYPLHKPSVSGEDYFGVYAANKMNGTKFGRTESDFSVDVCQEFLKNEMEKVVFNLEKNADAEFKFHLSCTLIGIGDADTKTLSQLSEKLGDRCSFYGITKVEHIESVFRNINAADSSSFVSVLVKGESGSMISIPLQYCYEEEGSRGIRSVISGAVYIDDSLVAQNIHNSTSLVLNHTECKGIDLISVRESSPYLVCLSGQTVNTTLDQNWVSIIGEVVSVLESILAKPYGITSDSFATIFRQLVKDRKALLDVKSLLFSRKTRKIRDTIIFSALNVWIRELGDLIESQLSSFRMNVEDEILSALSSNDSNQIAGIQFVTPSQVVLDRLQHNLQNSGKRTHRIKHHIETIKNIRDRSVHITSKLLVNQSLQIICESDSENNMSGLSLMVLKKSLGVETAHGLNVSNWRIIDKGQSAASDETLKQMRRLFDSASLSMDFRAVDDETKTTFFVPNQNISVVFPCILISGKFDEFSIVHASQTFSLVDLCLYDSNVTGSFSSCNSHFECADDGNCCPIFCMQEVWEVCYSSDHRPGKAIPLLKFDKPNQTMNMVLPLAYTPFLFSLYLQRGRVFHCAINVTGDCMALTSVSVQWGKFFHDVLSKLSDNVDFCKETRHHLIEQSIYAVVAYSYSIESDQLSPSKDKIFGALGTTNSSNLVVIPRDDTLSGLNCALGTAAIVACGDNPAMATQTTWNLLARTLFSRMCEAISGHKNIRFAAAALASNAEATNETDSIKNQREDPGLFEESYRILLGELQMLLRHRLHVEWSKLSINEKIEVIKVVGPAEILAILQQIIDRYLSQFRKFGLLSWSDILRVLQSCLAIQNYGIGVLKHNLEHFHDISALIHEINKVNTDVAFRMVTDSAIPVFYVKDNSISIREINENDLESIVSYIDALVATKVSPKVAYKPILNPSNPVVNHDSSLRPNLKSIQLDMNLPALNISFIGNVNSGKSSILGRIMSNLGIVNQELINKLGAEAERVGLSSSTRYAWLMDRTSAERGRGVTIESSWLGFQSCTRRFTVIDNPGHMDYGKNCANGIFQSDVVVLVTSALMSDLALSEISRSQAEEQMAIAFCFGIKHIVVCVNKMDLVDYAETAFGDVSTHIMRQLKKAGFKDDQVSFVPVSALCGDCLTEESKVDRMSWYKGPCLLESFDNLVIPKRLLDKPLRIPLDDVFKVSGIGTILAGKVECGVVRVGDSLNISPNGPQNVSVLSIETHHNSMASANPGENIGIAIRLAKEDKKNLKLTLHRGMVIWKHGEPSIATIKIFEAQLFVVRGSSIKVGYRPAITTHLDTFPVVVTKLSEIIGKNNKVLAVNPEEIAVAQTCVLEMQASRPFAGDSVHDNTRLSRFLIKENRIVVAIGFIRRKIM